MRGRLALLCVTQFLLVLDVTIVGVALPSIRSDLHLETAELQWVVSAYVLAFGGLLLPAGRLGDLLGHRRLFLAGLAILAAGSLIAALAGDGAALIAGRAVQGAGAAAATPAALALVVGTFHDRRERALAAWTAAAPVGGATGLLLGGVLTQAFGWPAIFLVSGALAAILLIAAPAALPADATAAARRRLDLLGAVTGTAAVSALLFALTYLQRGAAAVAGFAVSAVAAGAFLLHERRTADPLLPLRTLSRDGLRRAVLVSLALTAATSPPLFFIALHLQGQLGWSATATGLACLPVVAAVMVGATLAPRAIARHGTTAVMAGGLGIIACGLAVLTAVPEAAIVALLLGQLLYGAGLGAGSVAATTAGTAEVVTFDDDPREDLAVLGRPAAIVTG